MLTSTQICCQIFHKMDAGHTEDFQIHILERP